MPRYTEEQIEQVRSANDIVDVIGASVRLKRSGSGYVGLCPFHSEKSPSFSVNRRDRCINVLARCGWKCDHVCHGI